MKLILFFFILIRIYILVCWLQIAYNEVILYHKVKLKNFKDIFYCWSRENSKVTMPKAIFDQHLKFNWFHFV